MIAPPVTVSASIERRIERAQKRIARLLLALEEPGISAARRQSIQDSIDAYTKRLINMGVESYARD